MYPALGPAGELVEVVLGGKNLRVCVSLIEQNRKAGDVASLCPRQPPSLLPLCVTANAAHLAIVCPITPSVPPSHPHAALRTFRSTHNYSQTVPLAHLTAQGSATPVRLYYPFKIKYSEGYKSNKRDFHRR